MRIAIVGLGRLGRRCAQNLAQRATSAELVAARSPVAEELAWAKDTLGMRNLHGDYAALPGEADEAFLRETMKFVPAVQDDRPSALTLRDATDDPHRAYAARVAAYAVRGCAASTSCRPA